MIMTMQVAEHVEKKEIVGGIRGCIKTVNKGERQHRVYVKLAYVLGLRVSPPHRYLHYIYLYYRINTLQPVSCRI